MTLRDIGREPAWYKLGTTLLGYIGFAGTNAVPGLGLSSQGQIAKALEQAEPITGTVLSAINNIRDGLPRWYLDAFVIYTLPRWSDKYPPPAPELEDYWVRLYLALVRGMELHVEATDFTQDEDMEDEALDRLAIIAKILRGPEIQLYNSKIQYLADLIDDQTLVPELDRLFPDRYMSYRWDGNHTTPLYVPLVEPRSYS